MVNVRVLNEKGSETLVMTKEKAEKLVDAMIKKGEVKAKDKKAVLNRLLKGTKKFDKELERKMKKISFEMVSKSQNQIKVLKKKLEKVAKDLHLKVKKPSGKNKKK